jgi:UDP-glucose 4-epimerase
MLVALTGADGLIGSAVAKAVRARGFELHTIGRRRESDVFFDLASGQLLQSNSLRGTDALIHAAGVTEEDFADPAIVAHKTAGAAVLAQTAISAGARRLIYVSSAHVYGPLQGRIDETLTPKPMSAYGRAHLAAERLFQDAAERHGFSALVLRPCAVYGLPSSLERFRRWSLIPFDFPRQALTGRILLKSDGVQRRNFVAASQLGNEIGNWLSGHKDGTTFLNSPGPDEMSIYDFAQLCAALRKEEYGADCAIERPASSATHPEGLHYKSLHTSAATTDSLRGHVHSLMHALSATAKP